MDELETMERLLQRVHKLLIELGDNSAMPSYLYDEMVEVRRAIKKNLLWRL